MSHATVSIVCNALQRERLRMCLVFANRYTIFSVIAQKLCAVRPLLGASSLLTARAPPRGAPPLGASLETQILCPERHTWPYTATAKHQFFRTQQRTVALPITFLKHGKMRCGGT